MMDYFLSLIKKYFRSYSGLSRYTWSGILLSFLVSTMSGTFYFLSIYFVNILHINVVTVGYMISTYGIGAILGSLVGGKLSDITSPRFVSISSLLIQACAYLALIKLKIATLLMIDLLLIGATTYGFITSNHLSVLNHIKNETERLKSIGMLSVASNLGLGLSAIIVSQLSRYGFKYVFFMASSLLIILAFYLIFCEHKKYNSKIIQNAYTLNNTNKNIIMNKKITWLVLLCVLLIGAIVSQMSTTYSLYIQESFPTLGIKGVSILFSLNAFLVVFCQAPMTHFFKNYNKLLLVGLGSFLLGLGMFFLNFAFAFTVAIIACIIYTVGEMLFFSAAQFVCYQNGGIKKGHSLGVYRMIYAGSRVVGPSTGGFIYHQWGPMVVWSLSGLIGLICLSACSYFKKFN